MPFAAGYLVDLSGVKFDEATMSSWIQAMPYGDYMHPQHGKISLNPERANNFAKNFAENARGQELDIDYDHKAKTDEAAGWVKKVEARSDGLYYFVEWTKEAYTKIKSKAYKYFSPEFHDEWTNPANGKTFKDVLFGGGLTNRPFLKGILPINLSELELAPTKPEEGSTRMTPEQIEKYATKFGLGKDATEDQVHAAIEAAELKETKKEETVIPEDVQVAIAAAEKALADAKKLSETQPNMAPIVALMEVQANTLAAQGKQLAEQSAAIKLAEVDSAVKQLSEKAKEAGFALPIPLRDKIKSDLLNAPKQFSESFSTCLTEILDAKLVALGEKGKLRVVRDGKQLTESPVEELDKRVKALREADKGLSYADATAQVFNEDPDLYDQYREGSYVNGGEN